MLFTETALSGAYVIDAEPRRDFRGLFARTFCQMEFEAHGLKPFIAQAYIGFSPCKGTLRGLHFQCPPAAETKIVRCTRGAILDVIIDLRPESPTYLQHIAVELTEDNLRAIYVPERFAHGYQVLRDNTETISQVGEFYAPGMEGGLRHNDSSLQLSWPLPVTMISEKDATWPLFAVQEADLKRRMALQDTQPGGCRMIIVDNALKARELEGRPIRVASIGAGAVCRGLTNHIVNSVPGMRMVAAFNRTAQKALDMFSYAGREDAVVATTSGQLEDAIRAGKPVVTENAFLLSGSEQIDVLIDVTGAVEFSAHVLLDAFQHGKDVVLLNAEIDATIGPILQIIRRETWRHPVRLRRRRAGRAIELIPLGNRIRTDPPCPRKCQGTSGSVSQPDHPTQFRRTVGAELRHGDQFRGWLQNQL